MEMSIGGLVAHEHVNMAAFDPLLTIRNLVSRRLALAKPLPAITADLGISRTGVQYWGKARRVEPHALARRCVRIVSGSSPHAHANRYKSGNCQR
ncbi:hypothetical protein [Bradyrhizobium sp. AUGA SZCCT0283]|uniref:hypothetical protein n=1 Tax=Bradyrhizobium sp. AUGA SZCCT0283 TaxID=2807671 RepID=UPI001BA45F84|nr:hypothetical protein [Bradyrhizobium sp. AUGA SZCCT0283]MBR1274255.1 hypothetical protein [Bradyrhizobium sp. AUGA SZCCT0283]